MKVKKDDKLIYKGNKPYILADGNQVNKEGDSVIIRKDISVQSKYFELVKPEVKKEEPKVEAKAKEKVEPKPSAKVTKSTSKKSSK